MRKVVKNREVLTYRIAKVLFRLVAGKLYLTWYIFCPSTFPNFENPSDRLPFVMESEYFS
jgi:hypothetical protein